MASYTYLWEFQVDADRAPEFERHYGPDGAWVALFREAPGYVGTTLLRDRRDPRRYLAIDRWRSVEAYRSFRARFADRYEELDRRCEGLAARELPLGEFEERAAPRSPADDDNGGMRR
jgi:heme-degrading monooxygenase HmoA